MHFKIIQSLSLCSLLLTMNSCSYVANDISWLLSTSLDICVRRVGIEPTTPGFLAPYSTAELPSAYWQGAFFHRIYDKFLYHFRQHSFGCLRLLQDTFFSSKAFHSAHSCSFNKRSLIELKGIKICCLYLLNLQDAFVQTSEMIKSCIGILAYFVCC